MKVLVVDDNPVGRALDLLMVQIANHEHREAETGEEALQVLSTWCPDAIIMDLRMPGMGGLECIRRLRQLPEHARTPVVVISHHGEEFERAMLAGASLFIERPQTGHEMLELLRHLETK